MKKFCCIPWNETPNVDVEFQCMSACCASRLSENQSKDKDVEEKAEEINMCCATCVRKEHSSSHAKCIQDFQKSQYE